MREAAGAGATYVQTPEMTGALMRDKQDRAAAFQPEDEGRWSSPPRGGCRPNSASTCMSARPAILRADGKIANRAFLFGPDGALVARLRQDPHVRRRSRQWRELARIRHLRAGRRGAWSPICRSARLGFAICYDVRFPQLFRAEALAGAEVLTVPAAFTRQTGEAHWHVLLRARAIENGAFVIAAAQGGLHEDGRETYGHSLIVDPWGRILAEADHDEPGVIARRDRHGAVAREARKKIPNLKNAREFAVEDRRAPAPCRGAAS